MSQAQRHKPYGNPIFAAILSDTVFKCSKAISYKLKEQFFSSLKGAEDEREVPPPMLSFLGTAVCFVSALVSCLTWSYFQVHVSIEE